MGGLAAGLAFCRAHAGRLRRPKAGERCTASMRSGKRCRNWAVRGSAQQYGARLCNVHLPDGDGRKIHRRLPGPGERRCRALTLEGARCREWVAVRDGGRGLCWQHAFPHLHGSITHGFFRRSPWFSPAQQAALLRIVEEGAPMTGELVLLRLKLRDVFAYLGRSDLSPGQMDRAALLIFRGVGAVARLLQAQKILSTLDWGPTSAGGTGKMMEQMYLNAAAADAAAEDGEATVV